MVCAEDDLVLPEVKMAMTIMMMKLNDCNRVKVVMHSDSNLCAQHCNEEGQLCLAGSAEPSAGIIILMIIVFVLS